MRGPFIEQEWIMLAYSSKLTACRIMLAAMSHGDI
jgi:hypothetical protein